MLVGVALIKRAQAQAARMGAPLLPFRGIISDLWAVRAVQAALLHPAQILVALAVILVTAYPMSVVFVL
jgi:hypothetical protein